MENTKPSKKIKIYQYIIILLIIATAGYSLYRYLIKEDFLIYSRVSCDFNIESCFGIPCEENEACEYEPYKIIIKNQVNIPKCDAWGGECQELTCEDGEVDCQVIYCTEDNVSTYEPLAICLLNA